MTITRLTGAASLFAVADSGGAEGILGTVQNIAGLFKKSQSEGPDMPSDYSVNVGDAPPDPGQKLETWHYVVMAAVGVGCVVALIHYLGKRNKPLELEVKP